MYYQNKVSDAKTEMVTTANLQSDGKTKGLFTATTLNSTNAALSKSWLCTNDVVVDPVGSKDKPFTDLTDIKVPTSKSVTTTCARFLPMDTTKLNTSDDIRFDGGKDSKFDGSIWTFKRSGVLVKTETSALTGAFQAATVAAAVAVAALTF